MDQLPVAFVARDDGGALNDINFRGSRLVVPKAPQGVDHRRLAGLEVSGERKVVAILSWL